MPNKPLTICSYPGCATLVLQGRCARHPYQRKLDTRLHSGLRGYDAQWYRIRHRYLDSHPLCEDNRKCRPGTKATEVDHIVPLSQAGTNHDSNLRALCKRCHSSKTARLDTPRDDGGRFHARP